MKREAKSIHTKIGFYLILIAGLVELFIGIRYVFSTDPVDKTFGAISILESLFAFSGLWIPDMLVYQKLRLKPSSDEFKPLGNALFHAVVIFFTLIMIQLIFQFIPMTVREYDKALAIAFAGPSEESGFRGLIITIFILIGVNATKLRITKKVAIGMLEILGILISSVLFMLLHRNYYSNPRLLLSVFFSGVALAVYYWYWRDLTGCILAHFALNILTVIQSFYMVTF